MAATTGDFGEGQRPLGPFKLVTVNTAPDRAKRLVGRMCEDVKDTYQITHVANTTSIDEVRKMVEEHRPDILFTASMWSREEALRIVAIAREVMPNLRTLSLPQGLQMDKGPDAVVEYVRERLPEVLGSR